MSPPTGSVPTPNREGPFPSRGPFLSRGPSPPRETAIADRVHFHQHGPFPPRGRNHRERLSPLRGSVLPPHRKGPSRPKGSVPTENVIFRGSVPTEGVHPYREGQAPLRGSFTAEKDRPDRVRSSPPREFVLTERIHVHPEGLSPPRGSVPTKTQEGPFSLKGTVTAEMVRPPPKKKGSSLPRGSITT